MRVTSTALGILVAIAGTASAQAAPRLVITPATRSVVAGDSVQFDTNSKTGRLIGNVKMVITDKSHLTAKPGTSE